MSAILDRANDELDPQGMMVAWTPGDDKGDAFSGPRVLMDLSNGTPLVFSPDEARALAVALLEASGLALGAWGERQRAA
jgi:hypothetical protein